MPTLFMNKSPPYNRLIADSNAIAITSIKLRPQWLLTWRFRLRTRLMLTLSLVFAISRYHYKIRYLKDKRYVLRILSGHAL